MAFTIARAQRLPEALVSRAVGNDAAVNTTTFAAEISTLNQRGGGRLFIPPGVYQTGTLTLPSNVVLSGVRGATVLKAVSSLANNATLIKNATQGSYTNVNIGLEDIVIDGNGVGAGGVQARLTELVSFFRVTNVWLTGVTVRNVEYIGLALGGCRDVIVDRSEFSDCGFDGTTSNGGSALWCAPLSGDAPSNVRIDNSDFRDNRWHGAHFACGDGVIQNSRFKDCQESGIFTPVSGSGKRRFVNNTIDGITLRDISASGIEAEGDNIVFVGNHIFNCEEGGIALTDTQNVVVANNRIEACEIAGVWMVTVSTSPDQPQNIVIEGNRISDGGTTCHSAVRITNSGDAITGLVVADNNVIGTWSSGTAISLSTKVGANSRVQDNVGYNPVGTASITVGASPFDYTAGPTPESVYIRSGTVSSVLVDGAAVFAATDVVVQLPPQSTVTVTYTVAPTMVKYQH